jgi:hypothetical protein
MKCRLCKSEVAQVFVDLGDSPISNRFMTKVFCRQIQHIGHLRGLSELSKLLNSLSSFFSNPQSLWL